MSETAKRPPGTSTRWASRSTLPLSAEMLITQLEITTSTVLSSKGISSTTTEFYHSMRLQRNAPHTSIYPCYYWQVNIDYLLARRENSSTVLSSLLFLYACIGLRARMKALTNFPSMSVRSVSESEAIDALAPLFAISLKA